MDMFVITDVVQNYLLYHPLYVSVQSFNYCCHEKRGLKQMFLDILAIS